MKKLRSCIIVHDCRFNSIHDILNNIDKHRKSDNSEFKASSPSKLYLTELSTYISDIC